MTCQNNLLILMKLGLFFNCKLRDISIMILTHDSMMHQVSHRIHIIQCLFHGLILVVYNYDKQYYNNFIVVSVDCVIIIASDFAIIALCKTIWMYILRNYCYFLICIHVLLYNHHILFIYLLKIECSEVFSENTVDHIKDINWSGDTLHRTTQ